VVGRETHEHRLAAAHHVDEVCALIGADSLAYLSLDGLQQAIERPAAGFCRACLTGDYPVAPDNAAHDKRRFEVSAVR
jgi:amidophosphoribosyltransferase